MSQQIVETGSSNLIALAECKQIRTHWKWLFVIDGKSDEGTPLTELCVALLTQEKMHEYLDVLRAKGWQVSVWNITEIEEDPYSNLDELIAEHPKEQS